MFVMFWEVQNMNKQMKTLFIVIITAIILLGSSIHAFASSKENQPLHKYYTSVRVEAGDTLWKIAEEYKPSADSTKSYIKEICKLNKIKSDDIHAGDYIVVAYYSTEIK